MKMFYKTYKLTMAFLFLCLACCAQKNRKVKALDSLSPIRDFLVVCNSYKKAPLHIEMDFINTTNYVTTETDTASASASVYMLPQQSYIRFGEVEQLVSDSVAVIVSDKLKKIFVYNNPGPVVAKMKQMMGLQMQEASVQELSKKYKVATFSNTSKELFIELTSRYNLFGTNLPKETVLLNYEPESLRPFKMVGLHRTLIPIEKAAYETLLKEKKFERQIIQIEDKGYYLVKEQRSSLVYKIIEYGDSIAIPVSSEARIVKNEQNELVPAKGFEAYGLIIN